MTTRIVESLAAPLGVAPTTPAKDVPASPSVYERYLRGNEASANPTTWLDARERYQACLEEDPNFAPAWARLGRIYRVLSLYSGKDTDENFALAGQAFEKALELNPDLALAHHLYTNHEVELGRAEDAMVRLLGRATRHAGDPEVYAGSVQACRYCGLVDAAVAAHERAHRLDPGLKTAIGHAYLQAGRLEEAFEAGQDDQPVSILALELMGKLDDALAGLDAWEQQSPPQVLRYFLRSTRELLTSPGESARRRAGTMAETWNRHDPCGLYYLGRHLPGRNIRGRSPSCGAASTAAFSASGSCTTTPGWNRCAGDRRSGPSSTPRPSGSTRPASCSVHVTASGSSAFPPMEYQAPAPPGSRETARHRRETRVRRHR